MPLMSNEHQNNLKMNGLWRRLMILLSCAYVAGNPHNPHAPQQLTWQVVSQTGDVIWQVSKVITPWTWWPPITPDLCALAAGLDTWDIPGHDYNEIPEDSHPIAKRSLQVGVVARGQYVADSPGCKDSPSQRKLRMTSFYVCPRDGRSRSEASRCGE